MAFNNIMQLATAHITEHLQPNPTVVEWGNQRFRYSKKWTDKCSKVAGKPIREPVQYVWEYFEDLGFSSCRSGGGKSGKDGSNSDRSEISNNSIGSYGG